MLRYLLFLISIIVLASCREDNVKNHNSSKPTDPEVQEMISQSDKESDSETSDIDSTNINSSAEVAPAAKPQKYLLKTQFKKWQRFSFLIDNNESTAMGKDVMPIRKKFKIDFTVYDVLASGKFTLSAKVKEIDVTLNQANKPANYVSSKPIESYEEQKLQELFGSLLNYTFDFKFDNNWVMNSPPDFSKLKSDKQADQHKQQLGRILENLIVIFPTDSISIGTSWTTLNTPFHKMGEFNMSYTYQLASVQNDEALINFKSVSAGNGADEPSVLGIEGSILIDLKTGFPKASTSVLNMIQNPQQGLNSIQVASKLDMVLE